MLTGSIVGSFVLLLLVLNRWFTGPRRKRLPPPTPVDAELRARLGDELAAFLVQTRALRSELVLLEEATRVMLAIERRDNADPHPLPRSTAKEIDDVNFLVHLRRMRAAGAAWLAQHERLATGAARAQIRVEDAAWPRWFELPWGLTPEHDRKRDRSDELERILADTLSATAALARMDGQLSGVTAGIYR